MKKSEPQKSKYHQPAAHKPFFGAGPDHAFFSLQREPATPFFQPKAVRTSAIQAKAATNETEELTQSQVQQMPAFESEVINNPQVQRSLVYSPLQSSALQIQAKLSIGEPKGKYEQEADRVAFQVVEQINASTQLNQGQSVQRMEENKEELQTKPEITFVQPQQEQPEELQAKSTLKPGEAIAGGEASTELTSAINSARGSGQPLDAGLQQSMGQAMGADFSGVKVHTDAKSDQLNRSIQAKAFTTGQDVFFRQGAYEPGSRGGQELIAHELTHVVQQNGDAVQKSPQPTKAIKASNQEIHFSQKNVPEQNIIQRVKIAHDPKGKQSRWRYLSKNEQQEIEKYKEFIGIKGIEQSQNELFYIDTDKLSSEEQEQLVDIINESNPSLSKKLKEELNDVDMTLVREKSGTWREGRKGENFKTAIEIKDLNKLKEKDAEGKFKNEGKTIYVNTEKLNPKDKEKLVEVIAKEGSGAFAREVRNKIGRGIYISAEKLVNNIKQLNEQMSTLVKKGVKVKDIDLYVGSMKKELEQIKLDKEKVIIDADQVGGLYTIHNNMPFTISYVESLLQQIDSTKGEWSLINADAVIRFKHGLPEKPLNILVEKARQFREKKAYEKLPQGSQWQDEGIAQITQGAKNQDVVKELSAKNLKKLKEEVKLFLQGETLELYTRILKVKFTIKHATSAFNAIKNTGILSSLDNLGLWNNAQKASGMSSENNVNFKGDSDFAFFRFDTGMEPMQTRYGPTTIVGDADILEEKRGWVSLHDQLVPLDRPSMKQLKDKQGNIVRTSQHDEAHTGTGKQTRWINKYPNTGKKEEISFLDEVFYGKDIREGIALSLIREIERIGGQFKQDALKAQGDQELGKLLSSIYRVEAKLPSSFKLQEVKSFQVHNPTGDGRYYASGIIHPEGMAASAAYANCQSQKTIVNSIISGYDNLTETYKDKTSEVGVNKKLQASRKVVGGYKELIKLLVKAEEQTKFFVQATIKENSWRKTKETQELVSAAESTQKARAKEKTETETALAEWQKIEIDCKKELEGFAKTKPISFATDPEFEKDAMHFEQRLGEYAFAHPLAIKVVEEMSKKIIQYMNKRGKLEQDYNQLAQKLEEQENAWKKIGEDKAGIAGAVGLEIENIKKALTEGNLRVRMQHIYNFMNRVLGRDIQITDTWEKLKVILKEADFNTKLLEENISRLQTGGKYATLLSEFSNENQTLKERDRIRYNVGQGENARTVGEIGHLISDAELKHMGISRKEKEKVVTWHEGAKSWLIDEAHAWSIANRDMSLPLMAGPSGHTNAFMQAAQFLGINDPNAVRLAIIGHLLPIRAHSLVEIMVAAQSHGSPFINSQLIYRNIAPLTEKELRDHVAINHLFPHEISQKRREDILKQSLHLSYLQEEERKAKYATYIHEKNKAAIMGQEYIAPGIRKRTTAQDTVGGKNREDD